MEAVQRRRKLFQDELGDDLRRFHSFTAEGDFDAIRNLAHKYKMRLTYFGYDHALEQCRTIVDHHNNGRMNELLSETLRFIETLKTIEKEQPHERTDH